MMGRTEAAMSLFTKTLRVHRETLGPRNSAVFQSEVCAASNKPSCIRKRAHTCRARKPHIQTVFACPALCTLVVHCVVHVSHGAGDMPHSVHGNHMSTCTSRDAAFSITNTLALCSTCFSLHCTQIALAYVFQTAKRYKENEALLASVFERALLAMGPRDSITTESCTEYYEALLQMKGRRAAVAFKQRAAGLGCDVSKCVM